MDEFNEEAMIKFTYDFLSRLINGEITGLVFAYIGEETEQECVMFGLTEKGDLDRLERLAFGPFQQQRAPQ